jgi:hypothetical protein
LKKHVPAYMTALIEDMARTPIEQVASFMQHAGK